jgi:N-acetyl-anhydromuramyl-L-alanine amidase AmpD
MSTIACAACCAHSTLAAYEETTQATLAAQKETNKVAPAQKFDWEENAAKLRKLKRANSSLNQDLLESEEC